MRTYGKNFIYRKTATYKQRQERLATEWDVRVDISEALTAERIISNIKERLDDISYVLVSGVERPDPFPNQVATGTNQYGTKIHTTAGSRSLDDHVHIGIVLYVPIKRRDVLELVRGPRKLGDEYATPRNAKFTYAGWIIHHGKPGFKIDGEPLIRYEHGTLPMDAFTTDNAMKIKTLLSKWGTDGMRKRFKGYIDLLEHERIKSKIEQLQMSLEDHNA